MLSPAVSHWSMPTSPVDAKESMPVDNDMEPVVRPTVRKESDSMLVGAAMSATGRKPPTFKSEIQSPA